MGMPKDKMTPQQRLFADLLIEGNAQAIAYKQAYPNQSLGKNALSVEASRAARNPKIAAYVATGLSERRSQVLLTRDKKRQILGGIALDKTAPKAARIAAVKVDNDMTGDNAPVRVEGEITLFSIFSALKPATSLPGPDELKALDQGGALELPPAEPVLKTAMERAAG